MGKLNTILILMDELINYKNIPSEILAKLKGYNAFRKIGIQFNNIHCNRTVCSPSRSSIMSGIVNHGIQDNIDNNFQYLYIPRLNPDLTTVAKLCKLDKYDYTAYYGKQHFDSNLATTAFSAPMFNTYTRNSMKKYGFDIYSSYGDTFYSPNQGLFGDLYTYEMLTSENNPDFDWYDVKNKNKYVGMLPFLKARKADGKSFYCEFHLVNPHDTQHQIQNYSQSPGSSQLQYGAPYIAEQFAEYKEEGKLAIDVFPLIPNTNLTENYFEKNYIEYSTKTDSLPFEQSYLADYVSDSKLNSIFPYFVCCQQSYVRNFTFPDGALDVKSWKNLVNTYYGLVIEADNYVYKIYEFLQENNMLGQTNVIITSDHGDLMSAHGLKQKNFHFKESTNVPLIIHSPHLSKCQIGKTYNNLGNSVDIFPTVQTTLKLDKIEQTVGKSLLEWECSKLFVTKENHDVFHVTDGFMFTTTGFLFRSWFRQQPEEIKQKVISIPANIFDYISQFSMGITKYNGVQYKFVRYYNILEIFKYNFSFNPKYQINGKPFIFDKNNIYEYIDPKIISIYPEYVNKFLENFFIKYPDGFTFEQGYDTSLLVNLEFSVYFLMTIIFTYFYKNNSSILIPGIFDSYLELYNNRNYAFFCYDMDNDPNEIINLADPNYPQRANVELFEYLNHNLNENIVNYGCKDFIYVFPYQSIVTVFLILKKLGVGIEFLNIDQLDILYTIGFTNNFDSFFSSNTITKNLLNFSFNL